MVSLEPCDLTRSADCQALVDLAVRTFGRIDVRFNNAAMARFNWLEDISDEEWDRNRRGEVDLVFFLTRAAWNEGLVTGPRRRRAHGFTNFSVMRSLSPIASYRAWSFSPLVCVGGSAQTPPS